MFDYFSHHDAPPRFGPRAAPRPYVPVQGRARPWEACTAVPGASDVADVAPESGSLDHYARLSRRLLGAPAAMVSVIEAERQVFPGAVGLAETLMTSRQTPIGYSLCRYVVQDATPLVVNDARVHPRFRDHPAIEGLGVIAYIGAPLTDEAGRTIGAVCAVDSEPRTWTAGDLEALQDLAAACSAELLHTRRIKRDGEQLARSIFASTDIALAFYDTSGELVLANAPARRVAELGGFLLDEKPYGGIHAYRPDGRTFVPLSEQIIPRFLAGDFTTHEPQWLGRPGRQIVVSASAQHVTRSDGRPWGTLVALQDVTDLARAVQVKDELIASVSHELRTPLTSIRGYAEMLTDEFEGADGLLGDALEVIGRAALTLQVRIDELLDSGVRQWSLAVETTDVAALANEVAATFVDPANDEPVHVTVEGGTCCRADVDPARFGQVLENLLSNAVKFTPRGGRVEVVVHASDEQVLVDVVDDGIGMTEDEVSQAFDTFWRGDPARFEAIQGFGIGLTVVQRLVEAHHGTISIHSNPGQGTTVTVALPRRPADPAD